MFSKIERAFLDDDTFATATSSSTASSESIKAYVDSVATGLDWKASCRAATTAALAANTYANGSSGVGATLTANANGALAAVDGVTLVATNRLLVQDEVTGANNGIYVVTQVGTAGTPYILTRATDADTAAEVTAGMTTFISEGTVNGNSSFSLISDDAIVIGTTTLTFALTGGSSGDVSKVGTPANNEMAVWTGDGTLEGTSDFTYDGTNLNLITAKNFQIAGATILADAAGTTTLSGIDALDSTTETTIEAAIDTLANLVSIGTITTGVWNGTDVSVAAGGTGLSATTAYAVLCGGTTSTGALQSIAGVGTAGQLLTSNGAGALPTFQAVAGGSVFFDDDGSTPTTAPSATGSDAIAIGDGAVASSPKGYALGYNATAGTATTFSNIAIGGFNPNGAGTTSLQSTGDGSINIGAGHASHASGNVTSIASGTGAILISPITGTISSSGTYSQATGTSNICLGPRNLVGSGSDSICLGSRHTVSAANSIVISSQTDVTTNSGPTLLIAVGDASTANGDKVYSFGGGNSGGTPGNQCLIGRRQAGGNHNSYVIIQGMQNNNISSGEAQNKVTYFPSITTTDATPTALSTNGATAASGTRMIIGSGFSAAFQGLIVGRTTAGTTSAFQLSGAIKNEGGTTALVGTPTVTVLGEDDGTTDLAITADNTNDALILTVTGVAATTYLWSGFVDLTFVYKD